MGLVRDIVRPVVRNMVYPVDSKYSSWSSSRFTSAAKIVVDSDSQLTLSWVNNGEQDYDSISIHSSTDNITFTEKTTAATGATTKAITGLDFTNDYYFRIYYVKDGSLSSKYASAVCTSFTLNAVTAGAATLTLTKLDVIANEGIRINWGNTTANNYTDEGARSRAYTGAGTYTVRVINARALTYVGFNSAILVNFNSNIFKKCGDNLASIYLSGNLVTPTINSADMAHLKLNSQLYLYFTQSGNYTINSSHFSAYTLSYQLFLYFTQSGDYTIDSSHFSAYTLNSQLYLYFPQVGDYTISRSDFTYYTCPTVNIILNGITETQVDNILLGFYDSLPLKTNDNGALTIAYTAPSGLYQAPASCAIGALTGKEAAYELLNDSCGRASGATKKWATVTVQGGLS